MVYAALGVGVLTTVALVATGACSKKKAGNQDVAINHTAKCIFCPKSETNPKSVPDAQQIVEVASMRALLDTTPMVNGHTLLVTCAPKMRAHELNDHEVLIEHAVLKGLVEAFRKKYKAHDYLVHQKNGPPAGQSIHHYHKHVYPLASTMQRLKAYFNFTLKFATAGLCSAKLQGSKLEKEKSELSSLFALDFVSRVSRDYARGSDSAQEEHDSSLAMISVVQKQIGPGHVVIRTIRKVGKAHERTPDEVVACHHALQKVVRAYNEVFKTDDYVQIEENGEAAGQSDGHFQTHVYAVPKTNHEYLRQLEALVKYFFPRLRTQADRESNNENFTQRLKNLAPNMFQGRVSLQ